MSERLLTIRRNTPLIVLAGSGKSTVVQANRRESITGVVVTSPRSILVQQHGRSFRSADIGGGEPGEAADVKLALSIPLNGAVTGTTAIFTATFPVVITRMVLRPQAVVGVVGNLLVSAGCNVAADDVFAGSLFRALASGKQLSFVPQNAGRFQLGSGDIFKVGITAPTSATALTFQVDVIGYRI